MSRHSHKSPPIVEISETAAGWVWELYTHNNQLVADSRAPFKTRHAAELNYKALARLAPLAAIKIQTLKMSAHANGKDSQPEPA